MPWDQLMSRFIEHEEGTGARLSDLIAKGGDMYKGDLVEALDQWSDCEIVVVVVINPDDDDIADGDVLSIESAGDVSYQNGRIQITAGLPED